MFRMESAHRSINRTNDIEPDASISVMSLSTSTDLLGTPESVKLANEPLLTIHPKAWEPPRIEKVLASLDFLAKTIRNRQHRTEIQVSFQSTLRKMACFNFLAARFGFIALVTGAAVTGHHHPVKQASDFHFKPWLNRADCPMAGGTKYSVLSKDFGILRGWDTHARKYHWGPYAGISFQECIQKCAEKKGCGVATFTGTCYLKKSALGKGFVHNGKKNDMTAIKLHHGGKKHHDKGGKGGHKKHHKDGHKKNHQKGGKKAD